MKFYWELVQFDDTVSLIPPDSVEVVKRRWADGQPIHLETMSIPANQIKKFTISEKPYSNQKLLEGVAQAFDEPILDKRETAWGYTDETIRCRWVKKTVTNDKWIRFYSNIPGYKFLREDMGMTVVGFKLPVHMRSAVDNCSEDEVKILTSS